MDMWPCVLVLSVLFIPMIMRGLLEGLQVRVRLPFERIRRWRRRVARQAVGALFPRLTAMLSRPQIHYGVLARYPDLRIVDDDEAPPRSRDTRYVGKELDAIARAAQRRRNQGQR